MRSEGWTLVEFVGGPRDGERARTDELGSEDLDAPGYARGNGAPGAAGSDRWAELESEAVAGFGLGVPHAYVRMVWSNGRTQPPLVTAPDAETRRRSRRQRFEQTLLNGEEHEARVIANAIMADGIPATQLISEVLAPAMVRIGDAWQVGEISIFEEHKAAATVSGILGQHSGSAPTARRGRVVVCTLHGETHLLPAQMAAVALREDGWCVDHLGGATPIEEILRLIEDREIRLVVLSTTVDEPRQTSRTEEAADVLHRAGVTVLVGQRGATLNTLQTRARAASL